MKNRIILLLIPVVLILLILVFIKLNADKEDKFEELVGLQVINESGSYDSEAEKKSNFIIVLTNQSFLKPEMEFSVYVDGIKIITQNCKVEGQHQSYNYYYFLEGKHEIKVKTADGTELVRIIDLNAKMPIWNIFTYWNSEKDGASLMCDKMETPFIWD
ncbi:MAG: hypothetical protein CVU84_02080 [Firmicutes bacterium HGW-Firmicutes-1]|jgi:hypothetical protein|nr:MAG: hypothetical protein CVU84_02080 [Firmicutes bacterium HGW-Firmicutes-1]